MNDVALVYPLPHTVSFFRKFDSNLVKKFSRDPEFKSGVGRVFLKKSQTIVHNESWTGFELPSDIL